MERNGTNKRSAIKSGIIKISVCAMLIGISVAVGWFCRLYLTFGVFIRVTFENLPIILCGILFGPIYGLCVGLCTDLVSCVVSAQEINPIITLGAASVGLISGLTSKLLSKISVGKVLRVIAPCFLAHIIGCMFIKTLGLQVYYFSTTPYWYLFGIRSAVYVPIAIIEALILVLLLKNNFIKEFSDYEL